MLAIPTDIPLQVSACEALLQAAKVRARRVYERCRRSAPCGSICVEDPQELLQAQDWEGATAAHMAVRGAPRSVGCCAPDKH